MKLYHPRCMLLSGVRLYYLMIKAGDKSKQLAYAACEVAKKLPASFSRRFYGYFILGEADILIRVWASEQELEEWHQKLRECAAIRSAAIEIRKLLVTDSETWYQHKIEASLTNHTSGEPWASVLNSMTLEQFKERQFPNSLCIDSSEPRRRSSHKFFIFIREPFTLSEDQKLFPLLKQAYLASGEKTAARNEEREYVKKLITVFAKHDHRISIYRYHGDRSGGNDRGIIIKAETRSLEEAGKIVFAFDEATQHQAVGPDRGNVLRELSGTISHLVLSPIASGWGETEALPERRADHNDVKKDVENLLLGPPVLPIGARSSPLGAAADSEVVRDVLADDEVRLWLYRDYGHWHPMLLEVRKVALWCSSSQKMQLRQWLLKECADLEGDLRRSMAPVLGPEWDYVSAHLCNDREAGSVTEGQEKQFGESEIDRAKCDGCFESVENTENDPVKLWLENEATLRGLYIALSIVRSQFHSRIGEVGDLVSYYWKRPTDLKIKDLVARLGWGNADSIEKYKSQMTSISNDFRLFVDALGKAPRGEMTLIDMRNHLVHGKWNDEALWHERTKVLKRFFLIRLLRPRMDEVLRSIAILQQIKDEIDPHENGPAD